MVQQNIKKYSEFRVDKWWDVKVGSTLFNCLNFGKQRCSKEKIETSFGNPNLTQNKIPYYKVGNEIYNMILCPSGCFIKGSNVSDHKNPIAEVEFGNTFLLGETEITQEIYESVMGINPSAFKKDPKNPVEQVSWYDALIFCNKLSDMFELDRCYRITKYGKIIDTIEEKQEYYLIEIDITSKGFRLPTEWEWEYAAKAGTPLKYSGSNIADEVGWYYINSNNTTHPIKQKKPNAWGFYDMSGNVSEWCEDRYDDSENRVCRGSNCFRGLVGLEITYRKYENPYHRTLSLGFRVCRYI